MIVTLGLDVELMATPEFNRTARRDQVGAFLDAVADYVDVDGDASLSGLLSYFQAKGLFDVKVDADLKKAVESVARGHASPRAFYVDKVAEGVATE